MLLKGESRQSVRNGSMAARPHATIEGGKRALIDDERAEVVLVETLPEFNHFGQPRPGRRPHPRHEVGDLPFEISPLIREVFQKADHSGLTHIVASTDYPVFNDLEDRRKFLRVIGLQLDDQMIGQIA